MQVIDICLACKNTFSTLRVPLNLPCGHSLCQICIIQEFEKDKKNQCRQCHQVSDLNPKRLQKNEMILSKLKDVEELQEQFANYKKDLFNEKEKIKDIMKLIVQKQNSI